jgi:Ca-activated chloride channel family protein
MKRNTRIILAVMIVGALGAVAVLINGCSAKPGVMVQSSPKPAATITMEEPMSAGGTTPPNDAAYDAMFFKNYGVNPFIDVDPKRHYSTFAVDVDTGAYTICRKYLNDGHMPPDEAVRTEEFINYFKYRYDPPTSHAFAVYLDGAPSKFGGENYQLLRIGIKGREIAAEERKDANLVFVIDTSGSMEREDRLELVKKALRLLVDQLRKEDRIGIVQYGTNARKVCDPMTLKHRDEIISAIESLHPEGSTNAEEGIVQGYQMAEKVFDADRINRVILCSDGVANVGNTGADTIFKRIEQMAKKGIFLSTVGFGMGNYNDVLMEQLGDRGNGHYAYVDTLQEAKRVFVENLTGTLQVVAKDVKVQVDFNPEVVEKYRLIGYENRRLKDQDFRNDKVGGGEIGAGHTVTALYEIKYLDGAKPGRVATVSVRYKNPDASEDAEAREVSREINSGEFARSFDAANADFRLAAAVAEFAEILKKSFWAQGSRFSDVMPVIREVLNQRPNDADVIELLDLVSKANKISPDEVPVPQKRGE